jgi:DNA-3-methyladenine glycosylase
MLAPDPELLLSAAPALPPAGREFFLRRTRQAARDLVGAWFVRRVGGKLYGARLVEVEAYLGVGDAAAHSFGGRRTDRVRPMYAAGGHLYVFLVYGMHCCANLVTRQEGTPEAVLIRAAEAPAGDQRRLAGPAKFCRAMGLDCTFSGIDLLARQDFTVYPDPQRRGRVARSPRIGVDYAGEAAAWPLRYYLRGSPALSGPAWARRG